jgi:porphobilinogen synthase
VSETRLTPDAFVYPMFVCPGEGVRKEVKSMPGVFNLSVDQAVKEAQEVHRLGVPSAILFGLPDKKDEVATGAWHENGIVQQAAREWWSEVERVMMESLLSIRRAGASIILTYYAKDAARLLA